MATNDDVLDEFKKAKFTILYFVFFFLIWRTKFIFLNLVKSAHVGKFQNIASYEEYMSLTPVAYKYICFYFYYKNISKSDVFS